METRLKHPRRQRQQKPYKFAYLTLKNSIFARAFFIFFDILKMFSFFVRHEMTCFAVAWKTWAYGDNCSILSRKVRTHFSSIMTLNNWKLIWETQGYIFRWRSRFGRRRACWSSLLPLTEYQTCKKFRIKQVHQDPISTVKKKKGKNYEATKEFRYCQS